MALKIIDRSNPKHVHYPPATDGQVIVYEGANGLVTAPQETIDEFFDLTPEQREVAGYVEIEHEIQNSTNRPGLKKAAPKDKILTTPEKLASIDQIIEDRAAGIERTPEEFQQLVADRLAGKV